MGGCHDDLQKPVRIIWLVAETRLYQQYCRRAHFAQLEPYGDRGKTRGEGRWREGEIWHPM